MTDAVVDAMARSTAGPTVDPDDTGDERPPSALRSLLRKRAAVFSLAVIVFFVLLAIFAPLVAPDDPNAQNLALIHRPPSSAHLLGNDELGRDVLSRVIYGTRVSLIAGLEAVSIAVLLGVPAGLLAGYSGGTIDALLGRFNDAMMAVPGLVLALTVVAVLGPGLHNAMFAIGVIIAPSFFRITRGSTIDVRHNTFIEASIVVGCSKARVMFSHVLPNALSPLLVHASLVLGAAVIAEAGLSFLGVGVKPPTPSWGGMLSVASQNLHRPYLLWGPGSCLILLVLAFTLLGDSLRDVVAGTPERE
jgi:peptide/nickel transport system permease protein